MSTAILPLGSVAHVSACCGTSTRPFSGFQPNGPKEEYECLSCGIMCDRIAIEYSVTPEILPPVHKTDDPLGEVDVLLEAIRNQELRLATSYVRFARLLLQVRSTQEWKKRGFRSWGAYMADIGKRIAKARSQIYNYITVTETLEPLLEPGVLEHIGISKAGELRRYVRGSLSSSIPEKLLAIATDQTKDIDELRAAVFEALHQKPDPKGRYYDFGGWFCSEDERKEIDEAFALACRVDPPIPQHTPEPQMKLEVVLRWAREFRSTYAALV